MSYNTILATAPLTTQNYHLKMIGSSIGNSLIWDNGTNVGIGNTNTSYTLDVSGTGRFTSTLLVSGAATFSSSVNAAQGIFSSDFTQNETSKVGISFASGYGQINSWGANASTYGGLKFQLSASTGGTFNALTLAPSGAATFSSSVTATQGLFTADTDTIRVGTSSANGGISSYRSMFFAIDADNDQTDRSFIWYTNGFGTGTTLMTLLESGALSVTGAATFASSVTSNVNDGSAGFNAQPTTTTNSAYCQFLNADGYGYIGKNSSAGGNLATGSSAYALVMSTYKSGGTTAPIQFAPNNSVAMTITSGGNVLIGTTSDNGLKFQARYDGDNWVAGFQNNGSNAYGLRIDLSGSTGSSGGTAFQVYTQAGGGFRVANNGNVYCSLLSGNGAVSTQGGTGNLYVSSDANLKIEDGYVENGLQKILALKPRYFYWKDKESFSADRQLGFYAQEVNAISEETANTPAEGCGWGIYDRGLVALLTKAIQEMNTKLDEQNQTIQNLQEQINILAK